MEVNSAIEAGLNPFARYSEPDVWLDTLLRSVSEPTIDGVDFPRFPPAAMQERIHGHSNQHSLLEAFKFFNAVRSHVGAFDSSKCLLDFGSGWGRIARPFMPYFDLANIVGLEPNPWFCQTARTLNPYVTFFNSAYEPPVILADRSFDYIVSWSVFSHLSERLTRAWLNEFARLMRPGALIFLTTWGERFVDWLEEAEAQIAEGQEAQWYRRAILPRAGNLRTLRARYRAGEYVWLPGDNEFGITFIPEHAIIGMLPSALELVAIDHVNLPQSLIIIRRL